MLETAVLLQGTLSTVYAISGWIEQSHAKREKLRQLNRTTQSLSMVLEPLQQPSEAGKLDKRVVALLYEVAEILNGIKEHLVLWGGKQKKSKLVNAISLLSPSVALGMLYDDEKRLAQWMNLFTLSLQVIALRKQVDEKQTIEASAELTLDASWMPRNHDVLSFWSESFGEDRVFVSSAEFVVALQTWVKEDLDETLRNALLLELDRQNIGGVTCRGLEGFASGRTLKECVDDFRSRDTTSDNCYSPARSSTMSENGSSPVSASSSMSLEPTLVWIDDKMGNNKAEIKFATSLGIRVIQLPSTALAKLWIEQNEGEPNA
ncbi:hypothetical protein APHAL10511_005789 [Amanita phalloides]|nr:hypothetical protein APHAL10511_005789 [Amanita phalloides]